MWFVMQESDYQLFSDSVFNELMISIEKTEENIFRAENLLKELGLWRFREQHPASLSGGQKQRLAFAVGLMNEPEFLILDEPTSGLDGANLHRVVELIRAISKRGVTVIIITHDHELIFGVCQHVLYMKPNEPHEMITISEENSNSLLEIMLNI